MRPLLTPALPPPQEQFQQPPRFITCQQHASSRAKGSTRRDSFPPQTGAPEASRFRAPSTCHLAVRMRPEGCDHLSSLSLAGPALAAEDPRIPGLSGPGLRLGVASGGEECERLVPAGWGLDTVHRTLQWNQVEREGQGIRRTSNAGSAGSSPGQETKIPHSPPCAPKKALKRRE